METVTNFIKDFKLSSFGLSTLDAWIVFGSLVLILVLGYWLASFLQPTATTKIRKVLTIIFYSVFYGVLIFMALNLLLNQNYERLALITFLFLLPTLKRWVGKFYDNFDRLVDRLVK
jgi:hypothetical protein